MFINYFYQVCFLVVLIIDVKMIFDIFRLKELGEAVLVSRRKYDKKNIGIILCTLFIIYSFTPLLWYWRSFGTVIFVLFLLMLPLFYIRINKKPAIYAECIVLRFRVLNWSCVKYFEIREGKNKSTLIVGIEYRKYFIGIKDTEKLIWDITNEEIDEMNKVFILKQIECL